jgi:hypothetical protein
MPKVAVTGFSHMKGTAKASGKPYEMARLFRLTEIRDWKNDLGQSQSVGYETNDRNYLDVDITDPKLVNKMLSFPFEQTKPLILDLVLEPHPDDPMRNLIVDAHIVNLAK